MAHKITWPVTPPVNRPDQAPRNPNPVRRFREELRLSRPEFARLCGVSVPTLRAWERQDKTVCMPRAESSLNIIKLAKKNSYPITFNEMRRFVDERHFEDAS